MAVLVMVCTCILSIVAVKTDSGHRKTKEAERVCRTDGYQLINAKFGKEAHTLCLQLKPIGSSPLTNRHAALLLEPDGDDGPSPFRGFPLSEVTMAYGFPIEDPGKGSAEGYIGEDHQFYGVLHFGNRTLHADPYGNDDPTKYFGAFENDNMAAPRSRRDHAQGSHRSLYTRSVGYFPFSIENRSRVPGVARARICDLLLLADKEFFEKDANSSLNHVVRRMMHAIAQADIIFRNADFNEDGVPDNIGFSVKYILVLTSTETNSRVFGDLLTNKAINGRNYLMRFARLRRLSEVCLGVAFSGHAFQNRTLGLSFTSLGGGMGGAAGGLCDRRAYGRSFNTLAIAHATTEDAARVPERIAALTLAHEMGHSFGAHHDDNFPNPECRGHLMGSQSSAAENVMNFEFSLCSKRLIAATLSSMSYCLMEEDVPYCGNGIVEEGEACDCGLPSRCIHKDPCCTPRGGGALVYKEGTLHKEGCSVAPSAMCHPSQGLCCTPKCQLADLAKSGIDCRTQEQECTCDPATLADCRCGLGGRCLPDATCHAAECARLGLKECQCIKNKETVSSLTKTWDQTNFIWKPINLQVEGRGSSEDYANRVERSEDSLQKSILSEIGMCGICCMVPGNPANGTGPRCVDAQTAALEMISVAKIPLPQNWPDPDYFGPNISIKICTDANTCHVTYIRAWAPGGVCVTRNMVGICSPNGLCKMDYIVPRSNVYPDIMNIKLKGASRSSSTLKPVAITFLSILLLFCLIK